MMPNQKPKYRACIASQLVCERDERDLAPIGSARMEAASISKSSSKSIRTARTMNFGMTYIKSSSKKYIKLNLYENFKTLVKQKSNDIRHNQKYPLIEIYCSCTLLNAINLLKSHDNKLLKA